MPGRPHFALTRRTYQLLPEPERDFWKAAASDLDRFAILPDRIQDKDYAKYCLMPNRIFVPHGPTDEKFTMAPFVSYYDRRSFKYVINYYFRRLVREIAAGHVYDSLAFAGVLAHIIQDSSHPAHCLDNRLIYQYFPPPHNKYWMLHRDLDDIPADEKFFRKARISLLGLTTPEVIFKVISGYERTYFAARTRLGPLVQAFYRGNEPKMRRLVNDCFSAAVELTGSIWHTAHSIARHKFEPDEVSKLKKTNLTDIVPAYDFTVDPYFFVPLYDSDCDEEGNRIPLCLRVNGSGTAGTREFKRGIAMTFGYVGYEIPKGVYQKFRVRVGVAGCVSKKTRVSFKIIRSRIPPRYAPFHTRLLDYNGPVLYDSGIMTEQDFARDVVVKLGSASHFTLLVECPGENKNAHALWAEPTLLK